MKLDKTDKEKHEPAVNEVVNDTNQEKNTDQETEEVHVNETTEQLE